MMIALAVQRNWKLYHMEIKSTFLHSDLEEEIHITQPQGFVRTRH